MDIQDYSNETEETPKLPTMPLSPPPEVASPPSSLLPPSLSSSPSHEFSFTISLSTSTSGGAALKLSKSSPPLDLDLAPADDIFFQGHLLPLQLLHHRPSDITIDNAGFLSLHHIEAEMQKTNAAAAAAAAAAATGVNVGNISKVDSNKPKSLSSLFGLRKWLKGSEERDEERQRRRRRKKVFDLGRLWKKYTGLVEPFLFFKSGKDKREFWRSPYSFSGNSNPREGGWRRRWRGEFSAPASMRSSPANSGLLVAPSTTPFSSSGESTMEELQNAIQAAITHCKNSIAVNDRSSRD